MSSLKKKNGCSTAKKKHPSAAYKPHGPYYMLHATHIYKEHKWTIPPTLRTPSA